jgi:acetyl-CoA acetyltransferase
LNPYGGAIALGHLRGTTAVHQLHRMRGRFALCTMCIGVGLGIALVIARI